MTTYELARYRHELEQALKSLPTTDPGRAAIQPRLAAVIAEQESRLHITTGLFLPNGLRRVPPASTTATRPPGTTPPGQQAPPATTSPAPRSHPRLTAP